MECEDSMTEIAGIELDFLSICFHEAQDDTLCSKVPKGSGAFDN